MKGKEAGMHVHGWGGREVGGRSARVRPEWREPVGIEMGETEVEAQDGGDIVYVGRASFRMEVVDGGAVPVAQMARTGTEPHTGHAAPAPQTEVVSLVSPTFGRTEDDLPVSGEVDDIDLRAMGLARSWWAGKRAAMAGTMTFALGLGIVLSAVWRSGPHQDREALAVRAPDHEAAEPAASGSAGSPRDQASGTGEPAPLAVTSAGSPEAVDGAGRLAALARPAVSAAPHAPTPVVAAPAVAPVPGDSKDGIAPTDLAGAATAGSRANDAAAAVPAAPGARPNVKAPARPSLAAPAKQRPVPTARPATKAKGGVAAPAAGASASGAAAPEGEAEHWVDPWAN